MITYIKNLENGESLVTNDKNYSLGFYGERDCVVDAHCSITVCP